MPGWMACGRRGVTSGDGEGDALGQLDDAEGEDGPIAGKMPREFLGFSVVRPLSLLTRGRSAWPTTRDGRDLPCGLEVVGWAPRCLPLSVSYGARAVILLTYLQYCVVDHKTYRLGGTP